MKSLQFPRQGALFEDIASPLDKFNERFRYALRENALTDGFFSLKGDKSDHYLFITEGRIHSAGTIKEKEFSSIPIREFFKNYSKLSAPLLSFFYTDEALVKSIICLFQHSPTMQATTDLVDVEEVVEKIQVEGKDTVLSISDGEKVSIAICIGGEPTALYFAEETEAIREETPLEQLLVFIYSKAKEKPLEIDIYQDIVINPAIDSGFPELELPEDIVGFFTRPRPTVTLKLKDNVVGRFPIKGKVLTIGRSSENDVVIANPAVSRKHARVVEEGGKFYIEDLNSVNGTFVNGIKVTKKQLKHGDEIFIGEHRLIFEEGKKPSPGLPETATKDKKTVLVDTSFFRQIQQAANKKEGRVLELVFPNRRVFRVDRFPFFIGTSNEANLKLEGMFIGKVQATIEQKEDGSFAIIHQGGLSSTKVNGKKITEITLNNGDKIEIGKYLFTCRIR
ncbi:MAG: FHA domain-containing protein [Acidobacteria bacterium]|nr:FHA domain-containing protein [Acidobacteriota bacterium]